MAYRKYKETYGEIPLEEPSFETYKNQAIESYKEQYLNTSTDISGLVKEIKDRIALLEKVYVSQPDFDNVVGAFHYTSSFTFYKHVNRLKTSLSQCLLEIEEAERNKEMQERLVKDLVRSDPLLMEIVPNKKSSVFKGSTRFPFVKKDTKPRSR